MSNFPCVRCGAEPREGEAFIGHTCRVDPATRREIEEVGDRRVPVREQRRMLVDLFGWKGGWSLRRGHASLATSSSEQPPA